MQRTGQTDLPLHNGKVPLWLAQRMAKLARAITEAILLEYGKKAFFDRLSDPLWFQSLGCVLGMDWHSSGITTSVMGALKRSINPISKDLGIYICGGRGRYSKNTPNELMSIANKTGLDGNDLVRSSRLTAKVDSTAIQDGYQIYLHSFVLSSEGEWVVVQQGMNQNNGMARRYHWHSRKFNSFIIEPHSAVCGQNQGQILNLTHSGAENTRDSVLELSTLQPDRFMDNFRKALLPRHHEVTSKDVNMKRLGSVIALAHESEINDFESLLLLKGLGPRTLQSLTLVSEVVHGTPSRFSDPARFSFAHGGKDGHPFPVPTKVYDETLEVLDGIIQKAKIGLTDKQKALKALHTMAKEIEKDFVPNQNFDKLIEKEWAETHLHGGRTVFKDYREGSAKKKLKGGRQLRLF